MVRVMKRVLVLMSTYNGFKYLAEQLDSLFKQENVSVDVFVRDDGSKDGTQKILDMYSAQGKLKWFQGNNVGSTKSFMDLVYHAPSEYDYYSFCDQDDVWLFKKLARAVECLEQFPSEKPALYYSGQKLVDENLKPISEHMLNSNRSKFTSLVFGNIAGCTAVFNRILLIKLKKFPCDDIWIHDGWIYKVCVALGGNIKVDDQSYILYRQHGKNEVGLNTSFKSIYKRSKKNIFEASVNKEFQLIEKGYGDELNPEYKEFTSQLMNYDQSVIRWLQTMFFSKVKFYNKGLQLNYILKVFLRKL